jgi:ABC-type sugar transport system ATPase subunit
MLRASNISKSFGSITVTSDISLAFETGSVTAIVGDNGAGKSTFLKILAGAVRPDRGQIALNGLELVGSSPQTHRAAGIEMVYQDLALALNHDVVTNMFAGRELRMRVGPVQHALINRSEMRRRARELLDAMAINLPSFDIPVGALSGGQRQSVAIARALLFNPKVLLFDEPTAALGAREVERVLELIRKQRDAGRIVILVSHRFNDVFAVCDRVVVLKKGRVFSDDPVSAISMSEVVSRIVK